MSYLGVRRRAGDIVRDYAVAAADDVTAETLDDFLRVQRRYRYLDPGVVSILVCRNPASEDLVARAARDRVRLLTFVEYQGLIDFHSYVEGQTRKLEADPIYNPAHYVPQRIRYRFGDKDHEGDAIETVTGWLEDLRGRFVLVLGDFGTGKTFLLHELARRLGQEDGVLTPVLIEMRDLEKGRTLDELAAQHFARAGVEDLKFKAFRYMLREGRIVLLFDGFDELALRVTYERATEHFDTLVEAAGGDAKVVVTSRTQHFESDDQVRTVLGERVGQLAGHRIVHLRKFSEEQIRAFLGQRLGEDAESRFVLIRRIRDLMGLSQVPRMLGFIADLPEEDLLAAEKRTGEVRAADLYQILLDRWLVHEAERQKPKGGTPVLSEEERWAAVDKLALRLWERTERSVNVAELTEEAEALTALAASRITSDVAAHQMGSGTLLVRDAEGAFSFIHQSVLEWLVARRAARELRAMGASRILAVRTLSPLMAEFFRDLLGPEAAKEWAEEALTDADETVKENALIVRKRLAAIGVLLETVLQLAGEDLRGKDFSKENLDNADFTGADLTSAKLVASSLRNAWLNDAKLHGTDLSNADLRGADLSHAELSSARLMGADLRGAEFEGVVPWRTKLVGARLDRGALAGARTVGAALSGQESKPWNFSLTSTTNSVAWHTTREILASGHKDGIVRLWDTSHGQVIRFLVGHLSSVWSLCFSLDGLTLASGSLDKTIRLWDIPSGQEKARLDGHQNYVVSVCFSPDSLTLASGSVDKTIRFWDVSSGQEKGRLGGHQNSVRSVAFSSDGLTLASGSSDSTIRLWDVASQQEKMRLTGHQDFVWSICLSPDDLTLASGSADRTVRLWDVSSGKEKARFAGHNGHIRSVCFSPDGLSVASAATDRTIHLWEVSSGKENVQFPKSEYPAWAVCFNPDGTTLASGHGEGTVRTWDVSDGHEKDVLSGRHSDSVWGVCYRPDGLILAYASGDRTVRLWDMAAGQQTAKLEGHQAEVNSVCFNPEGSRLTSGSDDETVRLWDVAAGQQTAKLEGHEAEVNSVCFSPDGSRLASGSSDKTVRLWDVAGGQQMAKLEGHQAEVNSVCFSPDGSRLASGSQDGTARLWDVASGRCLAVLLSLPEGWVAYTPDGRYKLGGETSGMFWHTIGLCRFEPGELDPYLDEPLRVPEGESLLG